MPKFENHTANPGFPIRNVHSCLQKPSRSRLARPTGLRLIETLYRHPATGRAELARLTGVSRGTVSALVEELDRAGVVEEHDAPDAARPREHGPAADPALARAGRRLRGRARLRTPAHPRRRLRPVRRAGRRRLVSRRGRPRAGREPRPRPRARPQRARPRRHRARPRCSAWGWGSRPRSTREPASSRPTASCPAGTASVPRPRWQARLGIPVELENDANVGALGEKMFGAAQGVDDLIYVRLSAGIGAGLILGGRPYHGVRGVAGEIGHVIAQEHGRICRCGNRGCLETIASPVADRRDAPGALGQARLGRRAARASSRPATAARAARSPTPARPSAAHSPCSSTSSTRSSSSSAATSPQPATSCSTRCERRSSDYAVAPAADSVQVVVGTLGDRAEVLGAAALILAQSPHALARRTP